MKTPLSLSMTLVVVALLAGCAGMQSGLVLDTVGPAPGPSAPAGSSPGTLIVYSAGKVNADFNSLDPNRREFSDYRILDSDKRLVQRVHNVTDDIFQGPVVVELLPGKYYVIARSNGYGVVTVPVIIASHQRTTLHLDGEAAGPEFNQVNSVCLPDGEIVGWKSPSSN